MREFISAADLAGLPGMPKSERQVRRVADKARWRYRVREAVAGRPAREFNVADLPSETRAHLLAEAVKRLPAPAAASAPSAVVHSLPAPAGARPPAAPGALAPAGAGSSAVPALLAQDPRDLKDYQKQTAMARHTVLQRIAELRAALDIPLDAAIDALNKSVQADPDETIARLLARANARPRDGRPALLTRQTYYRWLAMEQSGGFHHLAPRPTHSDRLPAWAPAVLRLYGVPNKPSLSDVVRRLPQALAQAGVACAAPSYAQVRRFFDRHVGQVARHAGRLDARELRSKLPFVRRSFKDLKPGDIYTSDGHTFKAMVRHPDQPNRLIRPEITPVLDVATRKVVGWSVALHENQWDVLGALRHAFETHGVCSVFYVDNGPGFSNNLQKDTVIGMAARIGYRVLHSIPYNSQARGVIERFHGSVLKPLANRLASSVDKHVSKFHKARVQKLVTLEAVRGGRLAPVPTWDEFIALLAQAFDEYNAREHRSLGCSPNARWQQLTADGWQVVHLGPDVEPDLFWPQTARSVSNRGEVKLYGKTYQHPLLAEYNGERVIVSFDIHDPQRVIVRDSSQRFVCEAGLDANVRPYMPRSVIEEATEQKLKAAVKRAQRRTDAKLEDLAHFRALDHRPAAPANFLEDLVPAAQPEPVPACPTFQFQGDRYEWHMAHRDQMTAEDREWCRRFAQSDFYQESIDYFEARGLAWKEDDASPGFKAAD